MFYITEESHHSPSWAGKGLGDLIDLTCLLEPPGRPTREDVYASPREHHHWVAATEAAILKTDTGGLPSLLLISYNMCQVLRLVS